MKALIQVKQQLRMFLVLIQTKTKEHRCWVYQWISISQENVMHFKSRQPLQRGITMCCSTIYGLHGFLSKM